MAERGDSNPRQGVYSLKLFSKLPGSTACCSESISYVRVREAYSGQEALVRQQLCNQVCNWNLASPSMH